MRRKVKRPVSVAKIKKAVKRIKVPQSGDFPKGGEFEEWYEMRFCRKRGGSDT